VKAAQKFEVERKFSEGAEVLWKAVAPLKERTLEEVAQLVFTFSSSPFYIISVLAS
jgi:hypothetical protein